MKKKIAKIWRRLAAAAIALLFLAAGLPLLLLGRSILYILQNNAYHKVGETDAKIEGSIQRLSIYKAADKPFLLIGPCRFSDGPEEYTDFFFVNSKQLIRTAIDKGGFLWFRLGERLYMADDLTFCERLRAPVWDDLAAGGTLTVQNSPEGKPVAYHFQISPPGLSAVFSIPGKFFTPDMLTAPNPVNISENNRRMREVPAPAPRPE